MGVYRAEMGHAARAGGRIGALSALVTVYLTLLLAAGQAPYDWAWSRGQHATPAQWRAHERYEKQRGADHHGATATAPGAGAPLGGEPRHGQWVEDGSHEAHQTIADGHVALRAPVAVAIAPAPWKPLVLSPPKWWRGPLPEPPTRPPRTTGTG